MKHIIKHSIRGTIFACAVLIALPLYADDISDSLIGVWEGRGAFTHSDGSGISIDYALTIRRNAETGKLVGAIDSVPVGHNCSAKQSAKIYAHGNSVAVHGTVVSTTCHGWIADSFELTLSSDGGLLTGKNVDAVGQAGKITFYKQ